MGRPTPKPSLLVPNNFGFSIFRLVAELALSLSKGRVGNLEFYSQSAFRAKVRVHDPRVIPQAIGETVSTLFYRSEYPVSLMHKVRFYCSSVEASETPENCLDQRQLTSNRPPSYT